MYLLSFLGMSTDDLVYNEIPIGDAFFSLIGLAIIIIIYIFRKIPPFSVLWGFLVAIFVYAFINYLGGKVKSWFKED